MASPTAPDGAPSAAAPEPAQPRSGDGEPLDTSAAARRVLYTVRDLALELRPHLGRSLAVTLASDLDRDLAFDSLGRAELLLRLDRAFNVRLPDSLIREAVTPADLLAAVLAAAPGAAAAPGQPASPALPPLPVAEAPAAARTLSECLAWHVDAHPDRPHILLWRGGDAPPHILSYGCLHEGALRVAAGLIEHGLAPGERVGVMLPTGEDFFLAFFGALYAAGVPTPIYPPSRPSQLEEHVRRQAAILGNAEASLLITNDEIRPVAAALCGLARTLRGVETVESLSRSQPLTTAYPAADDALALIQYTSGSTGDPKGVTLTHANLLANIRAMGQAIGASSSDVFVSWLPLYHDMGLIGAWLACLYYGAPTVILSPLAFLADPSRWLRTMAANRATLSAAPNFAFELCIRNVRDEDIEGVDLSSLRMLCNGAEPVSPSTLRRFTERFAPHGFRPEAMAPVYGLAENAVGLAFPPVGRGPVIDRIDRESLALEGLAVPAAPNGRPSVEIVACGRPLPGHEARVVDSGGRELPDRREGRLQFRGPSATRGYFHNPERNRALFADGSPEGRWLETGDRAYIADGDLYLTGRIKDIIIRAGRNIYPQELEEAVGGVEGVRKGCVAAFAVTDARAGTERLVVAAETRLSEPAAMEALRQRIAAAAAALLDQPPDEIVLVRPGAIPKTSSGKLRRSSARELYESGVLGAGSRAVWLQMARLALGGFRQRLRRSGQAAASLAFAAWWWSLLCLIAAPVWLLTLALPRRSWRHAIVHRAARLFLALTGARLSVGTASGDDGGTRLPETGIVVVANHASYLDGVVLCAAIPGPLSFVAKEELSRQRIAGPFLRRLGTLFARRFDPQAGVADLEAQLRAARAGERVVSMPEGTLTRMPGLLPFHLGPFVLAAEAGLPVAPVTIRGTRLALRGGQWFPRRGRVAVWISAPIAPEGAGFDAAVRLRDAVRAEILARSGEPDLAHESPLAVRQSAVNGQAPVREAVEGDAER